MEKTRIYLSRGDESLCSEGEVFMASLVMTSFQNIPYTVSEEYILDRSDKMIVVVDTGNDAEYEEES
jgi:hypothetical protein